MSFATSVLPRPGSKPGPVTLVPLLARPESEPASATAPWGAMPPADSAAPGWVTQIADATLALPSHSAPSVGIPQDPSHPGSYAILVEISPGYVRMDVAKRAKRKRHRYLPPYQHLLPHDGYRWLRYGQKVLTGGTQVRLYFRCSLRAQCDCQALRIVNLHIETDPPTLTCEAVGTHNHGLGASAQDATMNQVGSAATDAAKERPTSFQCEAVRTHNHGQGASVQVAEATKCAAQAEDARASEPSSGGLARGEKQRAFLVGSTAEGSGESWPFVCVEAAELSCGVQQSGKGQSGAGFAASNSDTQQEAAIRHCNVMVDDGARGEAMGKVALGKGSIGKLFSDNILPLPEVNGPAAAAAAAAAAQASPTAARVLAPQTPEAAPLAFSSLPPMLALSPPDLQCDSKSPMLLSAHPTSRELHNDASGAPSSSGNLTLRLENPARKSQSVPGTMPATLWGYLQGQFSVQRSSLLSNCWQVQHVQARNRLGEVEGGVLSPKPVQVLDFRPQAPPSPLLLSSDLEEPRNQGPMSFSHAGQESMGEMVERSFVPSTTAGGEGRLVISEDSSGMIVVKPVSAGGSHEMYDSYAALCSRLC